MAILGKVGQERKHKTAPNFQMHFQDPYLVGMGQADCHSPSLNSPLLLFRNCLAESSSYLANKGLLKK